MKTGLFAACSVAIAALGASAFAQMPNIPKQPTATETAALAVQGAKPGDDVMTCEQIGMEMQPYAQAMMPGVGALGQTAEEIQALGKKQQGQMAGQMGMSMAAGIASSFLPGGGMIAQAQAAAQYAQAQRQAEEARPLQQKAMKQSGELAAQVAPMQQEPRFQRLMQLATDKKCQS